MNWQEALTASAAGATVERTTRNTWKKDLEKETYTASFRQRQRKMKLRAGKRRVACGLRGTVSDRASYHNYETLRVTGRHIATTRHREWQGVTSQLRDTASDRASYHNYETPQVTGRHITTTRHCEWQGVTSQLRDTASDKASYHNWLSSVA